MKTQGCRVLALSVETNLLAQFTRSRVFTAVEMIRAFSRAWELPAFAEGGIKLYAKCE